MQILLITSSSDLQVARVSRIIRTFSLIFLRAISSWFGTGKLGSGNDPVASSNYQEIAFFEKKKSSYIIKNNTITMYDKDMATSHLYLKYKKIISIKIPSNFRKHFCWLML